MNQAPRIIGEAEAAGLIISLSTLRSRTPAAWAAPRVWAIERPRPWISPMSLATSAAALPAKACALSLDRSRTMPLALVATRAAASRSSAPIAQPAASMSFHAMERRANIEFPTN